MSFLWSLLSFLVAIATLIAVHEFGHFWVARKCSVKVHRFSIGFGKVIWSKTDKQGTEFAISAIPLGGYVKMLDERNEPVPESLKSQAFNNKSVLQRALIIMAGPMANFIFAIAAYWCVYLIGIPSVKPVIDHVQPNSIAAQAPRLVHSEILAIDGTNVQDWESINMLLASKLGNKSVELILRPDGEQNEFVQQLDLTGWHFEPDKESAFESLGIEPVGNKVKMVISKVAEHSAAEKAGLQVGDALFADEQDTPLPWQTFVKQVQQGEPFTVYVKRAGVNFSVLLTPEADKEKKWLVGISPTIEPVADKYRIQLKYDMLGALQKSVEKTTQVVLLIPKLVGKLFTGELSLDTVSGPISIAKGAGISSSFGLVYYLSFMALISVNLGVMNLFPLPVLDGGHLVFLAAEGITGKPISEQIQDISYRIGAFLLLALTAFALFNDFLRL